MKKNKTLVIYNLRRKALDESCIDFVISTLCSKQNQEVPTTHSQQWDILEKDSKNTNALEKIR